MVQVREMLIRLNRGVVRVRYQTEGVGTSQIRVAWWMAGSGLGKPLLDGMERLIVETLLYSAIHQENRP